MALLVSDGNELLVRVRGCYCRAWNRQVAERNLAMVFTSDGLTSDDQTGDGAGKTEVIVNSPPCHRTPYPPLVFRGFLDMIDDENFHRTFLRFQFQAKLLLDSGEDRRTREIWLGSARGHLRVAC